MQRRSIHSIIGIILVVLTLAAVLWLLALREVDYRTLDIDKGWDVEYHGIEYTNAAMSEFAIPEKVLMSDELIMSRELPEGVDIGYSVRVYSRLSSVTVMVDGEELYSFMPDAADQHTFTGSGYHFVILPDGSSGKLITIRVQATEPGAFQGLPQVELAPSDQIYTNFAIEREVGMVVSIFLTVAGFMMSIIAIGSMNMNSDFYPVVMIGFFSILSGLWSLCSMKAFQLFAAPLVVNASIEYVSMFLLPLPIISLTLWQREHMPKLEKTLVQIMFWVYMVLFLVITVLHFTNVAHYPRFTFVFHIVLLVSIPLLLFVRPGHWQHLDPSEKMFQIGMWITVGVGIADVIWYYVCRFLLRKVNQFADTALPMGFLLMVSILIISYLLDLYARRMNESEKEQLEKLAFEDELTGLGNRARGEEVLTAAKEWRDEYAIINLDLNGLKSINDKYGHAKGDAYITGFSEILGEVFAREEVVARMGGDEFFVMLRGKDHISKLNSLLDLMLLKEREKSAYGEFIIDASYGVARSSELTFPNPEALYRMADQRMYKMKMLSKKGRR